MIGFLAELDGYIDLETDIIGKSNSQISSLYLSLSLSLLLIHFFCFKINHRICLNFKQEGNQLEVLNYDDDDKANIDDAINEEYLYNFTNNQIMSKDFVVTKTPPHNDTNKIDEVTGETQFPSNEQSENKIGIEI